MDLVPCKQCGCVKVQMSTAMDQDLGETFHLVFVSSYGVKGSRTISSRYGLKKSHILILVALVQETSRTNKLLKGVKPI